MVGFDLVALSPQETSRIVSKVVHDFFQLPIKHWLATFAGLEYALDGLFVQHFGEVASSRFLYDAPYPASVPEPIG